jgi:hypothetical protein
MKEYYVKVDFYVLERRRKKLHSFVELRVKAESISKVIPLLHRAIMEHTYHKCMDIKGKITLKETWKITSF